ncbi:MAG: hypothetical protein CMJ78_22855 [Planctomycetaceae bacterium]|nr:hypothetical protein [Planctomycetaceae bacterium]
MSRLVLTLTVVFTATLAQAGDKVTWKRIELDAAFRSEGVAVADINKDGKKDVFAGDVWYQAPSQDGGEWKMHALRKVGNFVAGKGYSNSFGNFAHDVNGDGWDDLILVGFPGAEFHWYENPQNKPGHWKPHVIWHSICNESPDLADITGDGVPEMVFGSQPESKMGFSPIPGKERVAKKWDFVEISEKGEPHKNGTFKYYHGLGNGDMNQDGRTDVLIPHGWWEAPKDRTAGPWKFHPYTLSKPGTGESLKAGDLHLYDMDLDGDQDIIMSSAHTYGVWWFENLDGKTNSKFKYHLIDESYSQTHAMEFVDINGDGTKDIVTGKRFFAHNGGDPGGKDPVLMYWYEIKRERGKAPKITAHEIVAGRGTGIGTQFMCADMNSDGKMDIALSNKKGVNLLIQTGK